MSKMKGRWINTDSNTITASGDNLEVNIDSAGALSASINGIDVNTFSPATSSTDGLKGAIPAPTSGDVNDRKALFADGFRQTNLADDLADVNIEAPSSISDNGKIFGAYYTPPTGYGDGSDGAPDIAAGAVGSEYVIEDHEGASTDVVNNGMSAGTSTFTVRDSTGFAVGDKCYLHQTQIGDTGSLAQRGQYEEVEISSISVNDITIVGSTSLSYVNNTSGNITVNPKVQFIKIVQYSTLNVPDGYNITCRSWNGFRGGILAVRVITLTGGSSGNFDVTGKGFRGGGGTPGHQGEGWRGARNTTTYTASYGGGGREGSAGRGGGGGHNGAGTTNGDAYGGFSYGLSASDIVDNINMGGGGGGVGGGTSGGIIILFASDHSTYNGDIISNGTTGSFNGGKLSGKGSGGAILIFSAVIFPLGRVTVSGTVGATGNNGASGYEYAESPTFTPDADFRYIGTIDADTTLGAGSATDNEIPTQLAVKTYVDAQVTGVSGSVTTKNTETLAYEDTYHTIGPLGNTPNVTNGNASVELTPTGGFDQTYSSDYTLIELTVAGSTGLALGHYLATATNTTTLIGGGGGTATGSDPSTGIDSIFSDAETSKVTYNS